MVWKNPYGNRANPQANRSLPATLNVRSIPDDLQHVEPTQEEWARAIKDRLMAKSIYLASISVL
jgi:hypothetical protein